MTLILMYLVVLILVAVVLFGITGLKFSAGASNCRAAGRHHRDGAAGLRVTGAIEAVKFTQVRGGTRPARWTGCWTAWAPELDELRAELADLQAASAVPRD